MIKFINIGLEDESLEQNEVNEENDSNEETTNQEPDAVDKAIEVVDNEDSNDAGVILKVANYKEELAKLQGTSEDTSDETMESEDDSNNEEENLEEDTSDEDNDETEKDSANQEQTTEEVEQEIKDNDAKAESQNKQIEENTEKLNESMEAYSLMLDLKDKALQANRRNMLTANSVKLLTATTDHIKQKLKISDYRGHILPAVESFYSVSTRQKKGTTLVAAMESIISEIFEGILKFIEKIIGFIFGFFTTTSKSVGSAKEKVNESNRLQSEAEKISKTGRVNRDVNNPKDLFKINTNYKIVDTATMNGIVTIKQILNQGDNFLNVCDELIEKFGTGNKDTENKVIHFYETLTKEFVNLLKEGEKTGNVEILPSGAISKTDNYLDKENSFKEKKAEEIKNLYIEISKIENIKSNYINLPGRGLGIDPPNDDLTTLASHELPGGIRFYIMYAKVPTFDSKIIKECKFDYHVNKEKPNTNNILLGDNITDMKKIIILKERCVKLMNKVASKLNELKRDLKLMEQQVKNSKKDLETLERSNMHSVFERMQYNIFNTTLSLKNKINLKSLVIIQSELQKYNNILTSYHAESCKAFMKQS